VESIERQVTTTETVARPAARVLLCDRDGRVLLFRARFDGREFWITPGGGLNTGETYEAAALRELWEETGLVADAASLACVWTRSHVFEFRGRLLDQQERFYLLRVEEQPPITYANWEADERNDLVEHRWWTADEIEASTEVFAPRRLGSLLRTLLQDGPPPQPVDVGL
jgi:8-oxo-dGTP pyrophosphatase MutT (NUDIX family)